DERIKQDFSALWRQGIDANLMVIRFVAPAVAIFRTVIDGKQDAGGGQAIDETVQESLGFAVDPVQIFEHQHQRMQMIFAQQYAFYRSERLPPALCRV